MRKSPRCSSHRHRPAFGVLREIVGLADLRQHLLQDEPRVFVAQRIILRCDCSGLPFRASHIFLSQRARSDENPGSSPASPFCDEILHHPWQLKRPVCPRRLVAVLEYQHAGGFFRPCIAPAHNQYLRTVYAEKSGSKSIGPSSFPLGHSSCGSDPDSFLYDTGGWGRGVRCGL